MQRHGSGAGAALCWRSPFGAVRSLGECAGAHMHAWRTEVDDMDRAPDGLAVLVEVVAVRGLQQISRVPLLINYMPRAC